MKKVLITICLLIGIVLVQGCGSCIQRVPFSIEEYSKIPYKETGTATVSGQGFMRTMIGEVRYAAGSEVTLNPITSYSNQWYELNGNTEWNNIFSGPKCFETPVDPRVLDYVAVTTADGEGRFEFKNVPAGNYYLTTVVLWHIPAEYFPTPQGARLTKKIVVEDGEEYNIILTK